MIRRHLRGHPRDAAGLGSALVFEPVRLVGSRSLAFGAFEHDLEALARDPPECSVRPDQVQRVVALIHGLSFRNEVERRANAQHDRRSEEHQGERVIGGRANVQRERRRPREAQRRQPEDDGQPVQPGVVAAQHQQSLVEDCDPAGDHGDGLRSEQAERHDELHEVAEKHAEAMQWFRESVEVPAQWIGEGLRLVMKVQAGEAAPAGVMAQLDQSRPELDAKEHPAKEKHRDDRRRHLRRSEEAGEKAGLEQHRFPAEAIEILSDVDDGQVERPQDEPHRHRQPQRSALGPPRERDDRQGDAGQRDGAEETVVVADVKHAGRLQEARLAQKFPYGQEATIAQERAELIERREKRDQVDRREAALQREPDPPEAPDVAMHRRRTPPLATGVPVRQSTPAYRSCSGSCTRTEGASRKPRSSAWERRRTGLYARKLEFCREPIPASAAGRSRGTLRQRIRQRGVESRCPHRSRLDGSGCQSRCRWS